MAPHARPPAPAWTRLKPPLIPSVGCSLRQLFTLIAHLFKTWITDNFSHSVFGHPTFLPLSVAVFPGDGTCRARS